MERPEGEDLATRMKQGAPPWSMISAVAEQVLTALEAAHQAGVIHGALTPQHIFLAREPGGRVRCKLHGFGVSRIWHLYPHPSFVEERLEAAFYLSPEHAQGKTGELGPASDCFSFASILFELVTGKQPFSAASAGAIIYKIGHGQADSVLQHRPDAPACPRQGPFARVGARPRTSPDRPRAPRRIACSARERPVPRRRLRRNSGAVRSSDRARARCCCRSPYPTPPPTTRHANQLLPAQWSLAALRQRRWFLPAVGGTAGLLLLLIVLIARKGSPPPRPAPASAVAAPPAAEPPVAPPPEPAVAPPTPDAVDDDAPKQHRKHHHHSSSSKTSSSTHKSKDAPRSTSKKTQHRVKH